MDCTPLLGRRTGVGNYTDALLRALVDRGQGDQLVGTAFSLRGRGELAESVPSGVEVRAAPVPARLLRRSWLRTDWPVVESLCGRVDVFHATNFVQPPLRRAAGVLTIHDLSYLRFSHTVSAESLQYQELVPIGLRRTAVVCTPSGSVAEQVMDAYGLPAERVVVTHLGVDEHWLSASPLAPDARSALGLPSQYLLAVGTLEPRKNLQVLIAAYRQLLDRGEDVPPLVLVGGKGWGDALVLDGIDPARLVMTGHLDLDTLRGVVAGASLLVFPSLDEGFGLPPLEAFAAGVPVLASDLTVTREVLGEHATFVPPTQIDGFAQGILDTLAGPPTSAERRRAHARTFSWAACAEATYAAYRQAAAG